MDALLEVDAGDVEAENVAGEAGDPAQPVAGVCDGEDPVEDEGPSEEARVRAEADVVMRRWNLHANPGHEAEIVDSCRMHDVVDGAEIVLVLPYTES